MSTKNRGDRIQLLQKVVTKHFTPVAAPDDRSVLEHMIYACCLEDVAYEVADEAFHRLQESFFDWNEVRVTTVSELCETLHNLPSPAAAALRIKKNLQSLFETRYSFDIDDMVKMNQGKAILELEKLSGMTKFVLGYLTQNALGGHSIPVSDSIMDVLLATEIVSESEAEKGQAPGLERTVPKTKGAAFASCLHQLAVANAQNANGKLTKVIMKEAGAVEPKKKPEKAAPVQPAKLASSGKSKEAEPATSKPKTSKSAPAAKPAPPPASKTLGANKTSATSKSSAASKPPEAGKKATSKKAAPAAAAKKLPTKKTTAKKPASHSPTAKLPSKSLTSKKPTKRKPR